MPWLQGCSKTPIPRREKLNDKCWSSACPLSIPPPGQGQVLCSATSAGWQGALESEWYKQKQHMPPPRSSVHRHAFLLVGSFLTTNFIFLHVKCAERTFYRQRLHLTSWKGEETEMQETCKLPTLELSKLFQTFRKGIRMFVHPRYL